MNKIIIYSSIENNKLSYVLSFIFSEILDLNYTLNPKEPSNKGDLILSYGTDRGQGLYIEESGYLNKNNIIDYNEALPKELLFHAYRLSFDVFSAIFYLLSRAEEYNNEDLDLHGRYQSKNSILSKNGMLDIPLIDIWISQLKTVLEEHYQINIEYKRKYSFESTIDIDQFFAFKHKPFLVKLGSLTRDVFQFKFNRIKERFKSSDPYDTFNYISSLHKKMDVRLLYFVLCAQRSKFDKNISFKNPIFKQKLGELSFSEIGIHPSYYSGSFAGRLKEEKETLASLINRDITKSRQHYVKLYIPETYEKLIQAGITEDHSMGYPEVTGFRAGTSYPFKWYNLNQDKETELRIYPFCIMDVTLKNYMQLNGANALSVCKNMIDEIKKHNGYCSMIWHNSSFFELESWEGWDEVYQHLLSYAKD